MSETLYPIYYGTRMVTFDVLVKSFEADIHPEFARRGFNFILCQNGKFGIGEGNREYQPDKPGFAPQGKSFHAKQKYPSGLFYAAWDLVVANPGGRHRAPQWDDVPVQGSQEALDYGFHINNSNESWHGQGVPIDGYDSWVANGKQDLDYNYPIKIFPPDTTLPQPIGDIMAQFVTRYLEEGMSGSDVKFYQGQMNDIAGQGLQLDGQFGPKTKTAVENWQRFFKATSDGKPLIVDGELGPLTQQSIVEVSLAVT